MQLNLTRPIAFFDLESTGTNVVKDRIVEISILKVNPNNTEEIKTLKINPTIPIPPEVSEIHGIYDSHIKDAPIFKDVAQELYDFLKNCDLAGFNSNKFDVPMLIEEFLRADIDFDLRGRRLIDVQNIFHKMEPRNLRAAYKFYCDKTLIDAHTAEADTKATFEIFKAQIERYEGVEYEDFEGNISTPVKNDMDALYDFSYNSRNVDLVGHIGFNNNDQEVFKFGKHKNKPVEEVFAKEPQYYDWMMKSDFPLSTKKVITAIKLRGFNNSSVNLK